MAITPYLYYEDVDRALRFLAKAFGLRKYGVQMRGPDGKVNHAAMKLGKRPDHDGASRGLLSQSEAAWPDHAEPVYQRGGRRQTFPTRAESRCGHPRGAHRYGVRPSPLRGDGSRRP